MPALDRSTALARFVASPVARLATVTADGAPHVVPICFAVLDDTVVSVVDGKPKSTAALRRLDNIRARPAASLLVDHYEDDWHRLWWVRIDGTAGILDPADDADRAEWDRAVDLLATRYRQYREARPEGAVVRLDIGRVVGWAFDDDHDDGGGDGRS
ncbi:MAG: TIGR03668 family PPOX class F420-dependent oxidoreductase [Actinomycetota bacterium]